MFFLNVKQLFTYGIHLNHGVVDRDVDDCPWRQSIPICRFQFVSSLLKFLVIWYVCSAQCVFYTFKDHVRYGMVFHKDPNGTKPVILASSFLGYVSNVFLSCSNLSYLISSSFLPLKLCMYFWHVFIQVN